MAFDFDMSEAFELVDKHIRRAKNPREFLVNEVHEDIIAPGWEQNFHQKGRYWGGGKTWDERGIRTQIARKLQYGRPDTTLVASGKTAKTLYYRPLGGDYSNGIESYSPYDHVEELQRGKTSSFSVTFEARGRLKKPWTVTMKGMPARQIVPDRLTDIEIMWTESKLVKYWRIGY